MTAASIVLVDTMIVIEAVDTGCWNAIAGQLRVATSVECAEELRRGDVSSSLRYPDAHRLDAGERDLLALATDLSDPFELCSCDKAAVSAIHALGYSDHLVSLEGLARRVGARPRRTLRRQYTEQAMRSWKTALLLGQPL